MGSIHDGGFRVMAGHTHGVMAVEHTSMPARRKAPDVADVVVGVGRGRPVVDQRVGPERDQGGDVVGGREPDRVDAADLADVLADLVRVAAPPRRPARRPDGGAISGMTIRPTKPVPHTTTRLAAAALIAASRRS